jgi:hypothetical protein
VNTGDPVGGRRAPTGLEALTSYDSWQLLTDAAADEGVARVVWCGAGGPTIVPVNFTVWDGSLWFQVATESRLARECPGQPVLVEVDHVDAPTHTGWSVIVNGTATTMPTSQDPGLRDRLQVWPRGDHQRLVKVEAVDVSGRRLRRRA